MQEFTYLTQKLLGRNLFQLWLSTDSVLTSNSAGLHRVGETELPTRMRFQLTHIFFFRNTKLANNA